MTNQRLDRRTALRGAAVVAAGATLAACGSASTTASGGASTSAATPTLDAAETFDAIGGATAAAPTAAASGGAAAGIGSASGVAVGGGAVFEAAKVVVTQPTAGTYKAFTAVCTHQGCLVASVANGAISCPCHGSSFSIKDGSVLSGPATEPLKEEKVTVSGGTIKLG